MMQVVDDALKVLETLHYGADINVFFTDVAVPPLPSPFISYPASTTVRWLVHSVPVVLY